MSWYINDISIAGQYPTPDEFVISLKELLAARTQIPILAARLFCSRDIHFRPVSPNCDFQSAVRNAGDREFTALVLNWLAKAGPFWDESRQDVADDYFECHDTDVTNQGLGEVARRVLSGSFGSSYSFPHSGFEYTPLAVLHGLREAPIGWVSVENHWKVNTLRVAATAATPLPLNWSQMLDQALDRFNHLDLVPSCIEPLKGEPFNRYVVERVFELLRVLNEYVACLGEAGEKSARNHELIAQHFTGDKAWFSDESETNKHKFSNQLHFVDPRNSETSVFCPWHGKIKTPQYRIHFDWPSKAEQKLRVFYIGPKITKT